MTKSIKCLRTSSCNRILLAYVILACTAAAHSSPPPCGFVWERRLANFLPAPARTDARPVPGPGKTVLRAMQIIIPRKCQRTIECSNLEKSLGELCRVLSPSVISRSP
ncbi:GL22426 [Drosophila persimilis]|uniref:GL22426 n=1 Tax=Drosophila persimilis TaxID=7234 RepID=B4H1P4_DROPE|nr:GL22426 [Drosophila persimilis]